MKGLFYLIIIAFCIILLIWINKSSIGSLKYKDRIKNQKSSSSSSIIVNYVSKQTFSKGNSSPTLLYQGEDSKQKFLFTVSIDDNISLPPSYLRKYHLVEGKINGNHFILKIPKEIDDIIDDIEKLKISVQNRETNAIITINSSFLSDISTLAPNERMKLIIDFNHPEDIEVNIENYKSLLPIPNQ